MSFSNHTDLKRFYDDLWSRAFLKEEDSYYAWVVGLLDSNPDQRVLDIAFGGGYFLREAEKKFAKTYGIEISETAARYAQTIAPKSTLLLGSGEQLPFKSETFDSCVCLGSLEHFLDPLNGLIEIARVTSPGGTICLVLPNKWNFVDIINGWTQGSGQTHSQELERFYSYNEAVELIQGAGLSINNKYTYNHALSSEQERIAKKIFEKVLRFKESLPITACYVFVFLCQKNT